MTNVSPFFWLVLGTLLSAGYHGRWTIPVAAWLALAALLHFRMAEPSRSWMISPRRIAR